MLGRYRSEVQAVIYMISGCVCFACATILIKYIVAHGYHVVQILFFRSAVPVIMSIPWLYSNGWMLSYQRSSQQKIYIWRVICAFIANLLFCIAVVSMPLNHAVVLNFTTPLFTTIIAAVILSEKIDASCIIALIVGFFGIIIANDPSQVGFDSIYLFALGSSLFMSISYILTKKLTKTERPKAIVGYCSLGAMLCTLPPTLMLGQMPGSIADLLILIAIGGFNYCFLLFVSRAYQKSNVSLLQSYDFIRLVVVSIGGYVLFDEILTTNTVIGSLVILCSTAFIAHKKLNL